MRSVVSKHDIIYKTPPVCWQDGFVLANGSLGAVFYAPESFEWLINKTDVVDGRVKSIKRVIPRDEALRMIKNGASAADFESAERGDTGPEGAGVKTCCRLTMDIGMTAGAGTRSALPKVDSRLNIYDGILNLELDKHLCHPQVESFVRSDEDMLVIRVSNVSPIVSYRSRIFFSRPEDIELPTPELWEETGRLMMRMEMLGSGFYVAGLVAILRPTAAYRDDVLTRIRSQYQPPIVGKAVAAVSGRYGILNIGGDFDLYLTVATDQDSSDPAAEVRRRLDKAINENSEELVETHKKWWHDFWSKSRIELSDKTLEGLFYRSLYALGCSYRKAPMAGLLGLCYGPSVGPTQITPWSGDLHHDQNVQCPFYSVHALNHSELFDAYMETYNSFLPEGRRLAREVWNAKGAHFDMSFTARGKSINGGVGKYRYAYMGSYLGLMYCLSWKYQRDIRKLKDKVYPFLKEILEFYQDILTMGEDGLYHLYPGHSCELDVADNGDPVQIICMLKICLETAIEAAGILEVDAESANQWRDILERMPAYPKGIDNKGREVILDGTGIDPNHHVDQGSGLYLVFPCGEVDEFSDQDTIDLYNRTLDSNLEKASQRSFANDGLWHFQCVWQCFHRAMNMLRLGRYQEFWDFFLPMFFKTYVKSNGLVAHDACVIAESQKSEANLDNIPDESLLDIDEQMPKFEPWCGHAGGTTPNTAARKFAVAVIEGSGDYLTMITETLLQSHNGIVRVFSAWPNEKDASFENLIAEGNIKVTSELKDGQVAYIKLQKGENCSINSVAVKSPWTDKVEVHDFSEDGSLMLKN